MEKIPKFDKTVSFASGSQFPSFGLGTCYIMDPQVMVKALQMGYKMLDTASRYENEHVVGEAVKISGIDRSSIMVISKVWMDEVEDVEAACRRSLARL